MLFIPVVVTPTSNPPSREAQELGAKVAEVVRHYQAEHPDIEDSDVRDALALATSSVGASSNRRVTMALLILGAMLAVGVAYFFATGGASVPAGGIPWTAIAVGGLLVLFVAARLLARR